MRREKDGASKRKIFGEVKLQPGLVSKEKNKKIRRSEGKRERERKKERKNE